MSGIRGYVIVFRAGFFAGATAGGFGAMGFLLALEVIQRLAN